MDHTDHITVDELLARHTVNPSRLEPGSSEVSGQDVRARLREPVVRPCVVCGDDYRPTEMVTFPGKGLPPDGGGAPSASGRAGLVRW
ncbi:hypothetical protein ACQ4WX_02925 [Streptomyces lasalocidi]